MKNPFTKKLLGRVLIAAASGAIVVALTTCFSNLYFDSWYLAAQLHKPAWLVSFMSWNCLSMDFLRSLGFGYPNGNGLFNLMTSLANALMAFLFLLVPGFLWQLSKSYMHDHKTVA